MSGKTFAEVERRDLAERLAGPHRTSSCMLTDGVKSWEGRCQCDYGKRVKRIVKALEGKYEEGFRDGQSAANDRRNLFS